MNESIDFSKINAARLGHNYFMQVHEGNYAVEDLNLLNEYINFVLKKENREFEPKKVGLMFVAVNAPYWQYAKPVVDGVKAFFLPGHEVEVMLFADLPEKDKEQEVIDACPPESEMAALRVQNPMAVSREYMRATIDTIRALPVTVFPVESAPWPYPTLLRYHLFLQQEEYLKKFDYIFYLDLDMRVVNVVGEEILGEGLTAAQHPMYAVRKEYIPPYEPNPSSAAYIPRPGRILVENDKPRFEPLYLAGGFQGGKTELFIDAMKKMKKMIDSDMHRNYIPIWNDESIWNRYLFDNPPSVVLNPSYVYPDSMIQEYYLKIWGRNYPPKIITITKSFSLSKEGGEAAQKMMQTL